MNRIVIPTGYIGSGSSAITDIVSGFEGYSAPHGSFEYVFMHCPNGLFDLEDKLLVGNNALRSDEALRSFLAAMKNLFPNRFWWPGNYEKNLSPRFMDAVHRFVNGLTQFKSDGYWYYQEREGFAALPNLLANKALRAVSKGRKGLPAPLKHHGMLLSFPTAEEFYDSSKRFLNELFEEMGSSDKRLILDQLLLPHNAWRMDHYFDNDAECFIVDRDPRDVFISNKYIWERVYGTLGPYPTDVHEFCSYYKRIRLSEKPADSTHVHRIHFEDLVYRYDVSLTEIAHALSLAPSDVPTTPGSFDPEKSINNTQLFRIQGMGSEARVIEEQLPEYLYDFPEKRTPDRELSF